MFEQFSKAIHQVTQICPAWLRKEQVKLHLPDDLRVEASGVVFMDGKDQMDYLWFRVVEWEDGQAYPGYRIVRLLQLRYIPLEARADAGLLQKMRTALRGMYSAGVNLVYLAAGMFSGDTPVGIVQCYGVATFDADLKIAKERSLKDLLALRSALTGAYRQLRLDPVDVRLAQWIFSAFQRMPHALVIVGHPDPRENARGGERSVGEALGDVSPSAQNFSLQQNELLFRGMGEIREDFLFVTLTSPLSIPIIIRMLTGLAEETSTWASLQQGVRGASFGVSLPAALVASVADQASHSYAENNGMSTTQGVAETEGLANTQGQAHTVGHSSTRGWAHTVSEGESVTTGAAVTDGGSVSDGTTTTEGSSHSEGSSSVSSHSDTFSWGLRGSLEPVGIGIGGGVNWGTADSYSSSSSSSDTTMHSEANSHAETVSHANTQSQGVTQSRSESWTTSGSETNSVSDTTSQSQTESQSTTNSNSDSQSNGQAFGQSIGRGLSNGLSVAIAPSFSISNSHQWQFDPAILVTQMLRTQQRLLDIASREGAYYTDVYALASTTQGKQALMGLIAEAFHGTEDVVTGVQVRDLNEEESAYISLHARTFTPSTRIEEVPQVISGYADSTILNMLQVAAYTAPGMYEEGTALTTQEATPAFAFYPAMPGPVVLGKQWSSETGQLSEAFLRLSAERHFHTAFVGDTGFGKSVAAERLAYETTLHWRYRTVILDFGQGWRKALRWPGLEDRVDVRQLYPGAPRPLRWNFLQVPQRIDVSRYRTLVAELFANAGCMGARQLGFMRRALTELYLEQGVLTSDFALQGGKWGTLQNEAEVRVIQEKRDAEHRTGTIQVGTRLEELNPGELQALAIFRSRLLSPADWVSRLKKYLDNIKYDQSSKTSLEGVLLRLEPFAEGQMVYQYGPGADAVAVENLGLAGPSADPWGMAVIEGGAEMDEYAKAALLSLLATILYFDAVSRRRESLTGVRFPPLQIFFEEANKILSGVSGGAASDSSSKDGGNSVSSILQSMWRDGRKYRIFLHLLGQTVSELPEGILASCANIFVFQTKNPRDRDLILPHLGRSEKGMVNTNYKRYLARIPKTYAVAKLGYSEEVFQLEPVLVRPLMVPGAEPSDRDIVETLGLGLPFSREEINQLFEGNF
jgi:hypothetical protein